MADGAWKGIEPLMCISLYVGDIRSWSDTGRILRANGTQGDFSLSFHQVPAKNRTKVRNTKEMPARLALY